MTLNRVGIIGWPVEHSLSPAMHNAAFKALGMDDWYYDAMAIPPDVIREGIREPQRHGYIGLNVTVPHKQAALRYVKPDEKAQAVGAVNTIDFRDNRGTNTDITGLIDDLKANAVPPNGENVVVLGAGGAARAAVYGLALEGARLLVVNRTVQRAEAMVADLTLSSGISGVEVAASCADAVQWNPRLIVNCTSVGMWPLVDACPWPEAVPFPEGVTVYDMIYRPNQTQLMAKAEAAGGRAIGGLGMMVRQGAVAFELWTGREAPVEVMFVAVREALQEGAL